MNSGICSKCGAKYPVKKDGSLWKHADTEGNSCTGAPLDVSGVQGIDKSDPYLLSSGPDTVENGTGEPEQVITNSPKTFSFEFRVTKPCPQIDDKFWHHANKEFVRSKARNAGNTVSGDARLVDTVDEGSKLVLVYEIDIL